MPKCTIRIKDEVSCAVLGLHPDHLSFFYEEYAVFAPNHFFNPKFKVGMWDGKIRFFGKAGLTYTYLLDEMVPRIVKLGYDVAVDDHRTAEIAFPPAITEDFFGSSVMDKSGKPWKMRDYQVEMVNVLLEKGYGIGIAGTGGGKTSMTAALAMAYERDSKCRSIIIVPDKNLTLQTIEEYDNFGLDVGQYSGDKKDIAHQHVVSTWQSLRNNPHLLREFQVIIVDECHGLRGAVLTKLMMEYANQVPNRFGVTGTLPKEETDMLAAVIAVGPVRYTIPAHQLIAEGHLSNLHIDIMQHKINLKPEYDKFVEFEFKPSPLDPTPMTYAKWKDQYFTDFAAEKRYLQTNPERLDWIATYIDIKREQDKGNVLCLVNGIAAGKKLVKLIPDAHFVYGKDDTQVRKDVYDLFKENDHVVAIATVNIASTGLDIPRIFNLIFIDMGKSFIRVIQSIGRGLRKADDKDFVHVTDICSDLKYSRKHVTERVAFYKEAQYPHKKKPVDIQ